MPDIRGTSDFEPQPQKTVDPGDFRLMENIIIPIDYVQAFLLVKLAKEKEYGIIKEIFATRDNTIARMVVALAHASAGNLISAWCGQHNIAMLLEHNYMIRKGGAKSLVDGANWLAGAAATSELVGAFTVPTTLVLGGGGSSAGALAKILGGGK
jgi:hypothetical protein